MSNSYYNVSGTPGTGSFGSSAAIRAEFTLIQSAFALLPALTANTAVVVNAGGTALTNSAGTLALNGNLSVASGKTVALNNSLTLAGTDGTTMTFPAATDTLVGRTSTDTLTNKTISGLDSSTWNANGIGSLKALGVGVTVPSAGNINVSGQYQVSGSQIASPNLSDYATGTWTPTDQSGAGLTITVTSGIYARIGKLVICQANITYPATADGSTAKINLPVVCGGSSAIGIATSTVGGGSDILVSPQSGTNGLVFLNTSNATLTNANLSGRVIVLTAMYVSN